VLVPGCWPNEITVIVTESANHLPGMPDMAAPFSIKPNRFVVFMFDDMHQTIEAGGDKECRNQALG